MAREDVEHIPVAGGEGTGEDLALRLFHAVREELQSQASAPLATYRLQLNADFRFTDAERVAPYLARLGVTDAYVSPYLRATPGSRHGYDCVDHQSLNPEIGSEAEHAAFCEALRRHALGQILDFVPNHMGIEGGNALWMDVLENGPASVFAHFFDIDWHPVKEELQERVLLPILGDQYGAVLERGQLVLRFTDGAFFCDYFTHALPLAIRQYAVVLSRDLAALEAGLGRDSPPVVELQSVLTAIDHLPPATALESGPRIERNREKEVIKRRLDRLAREHAGIREHIERQVCALNGRVGEPGSFDGLDRILAHCHFRVAHWRVAGEEINYRRFFDINTLAAIRVEDPEVFAEAHALVARWLEAGQVTGLRIDHPDGLFDPAQYFFRLQEDYFLRRARRHASAKNIPDADWPAVADALRAQFRRTWEEHPDSPTVRPLYVVVEKIQGGRERIPEAWTLHGTTGYRFANTVLGLFVDRAAEAALTRTYERFIGERTSFADLLYEKKKLVLRLLMVSELNVLARELNRISEMNRHSRDFTLGSLRRALIEFVALFPVYRSYVDGRRAEVDERDTRYIQWTLRRARQKDTATDPSLYDFLESILLRQYPAHVAEPEREVMLRFVMKVQQLTGPVQAKGLEDTVFYLYNRFLALNEVGGQPERFGVNVAAFHLRNQERAERWPGSFLTTATHDTKRGEDVRARLAVLSELPELWSGHVRRWASLNRRLKTQLPDGIAPSANDEYAFYQTLVGVLPMGGVADAAAWEALRERLCAYVLKAAREAKTRTSWLKPDPAYERALLVFVDGALASGKSRFVQEVLAFTRGVERPGQVNALAQVLLKLASPGTTDVYQGTELWDLSLVDPDNRRPVDFARREALLEAMDADLEADRAGTCQRLFSDMTDGAAKLFVLSQGLRFRRRHRALFTRGEYLPLDVEGPGAEHVVALARRHGDTWAVALAPRLVARLLESWPHALAGTEVRLPDALDGSGWRDVFSGATLQTHRRRGGVVLELVDAWRLSPVALLEKNESP